jgi:NAD(P)-dependent dehydrogenase (short-subunit alcohol dehydrogenase family)
MRASGALVSTWDYDRAVLEKAIRQLEKTGHIDGELVDVSEAASVERAFASTINKHQRIDLLVANAGISGPNHKTWEYPVVEWQRVISVNLLGVSYCCQAIVPQMISQNYGRIVNVASVAGKESNPNASAYSASKAGSHRLD